MDPAVLSATCQSLSGAAEHLLGRLKALDGNVTSMLAGWQGTAGGSYGEAWNQWHRGADEVERALEIMAALLGQAGKTFAAQEQTSAQELRGLHDG